MTLRRGVQRLDPARWGVSPLEELAGQTTREATCSDPN